MICPAAPVRELNNPNYDGNEIETTYEKAPEKVLAVYQGSIETMLALGLEDRLVATAGPGKSFIAVRS